MVARLSVLFLIAGFASAQTAGFEEFAKRAEAAIDSNPSEAAWLYKQALALRPAWTEGWLYLGATQFQLERYAESRDAFRKGTELEPKKGTAWAYLGMAEYELGLYQQGLADMLKGESIGLADRAIFVAAVHYRAALAELRLGNHAQALEQLRPLVRAGNDSPDIVKALGISALFLNFLPATLPADKGPVVELAGRAAWAFLAERADQAGLLFQRLVTQFPSAPGVPYMYGVFLLDRDAGAAAAAFQKELSISPAHVLARVQLALLSIQSGDSQAAEKLAKEAVQLEPGSPLSQVTWGRALLAAGRTNEAIAALERGERLAPDASRTHFYLQQAYQRAGRPADARAQKAEFDRLRALQEPETVPGH